jgi:4-diphosphocytidyl-2C-methyl-D-erythritol kinase
MQAYTGRDSGVNVHIVKGVPVAGGMAGGSADAAATLVALNALWSLNLSQDELLAVGAPLGADVPFSIFGGTAVGFGRGDELIALEDHGIYHWVFVLRSKGLSTGEVFTRFDQLVPAGVPLDESANAGLYAALRAGDPVALGQNLHNDLQIPAFNMAPDLLGTVAAARDLGALSVLLSGSGPTIAVLVDSAEAAQSMREGLLAVGVHDALAAQGGSVRGAHVV